MRRELALNRTNGGFHVYIREKKAGFTFDHACPSRNRFSANPAQRTWPSTSSSRGFGHGRAPARTTIWHRLLNNDIKRGRKPRTTRYCGWLVNDCWAENRAIG